MVTMKKLLLGFIVVLFRTNFQISARSVVRERRQAPNLFPSFGNGVPFGFGAGQSQVGPSLGASIGGQSIPGVGIPPITSSSGVGTGGVQSGTSVGNLFGQQQGTTLNNQNGGLGVGSGSGISALGQNLFGQQQGTTLNNQNGGLGVGSGSGISALGQNLFGQQQNTNVGGRTADGGNAFGTSSGVSAGGANIQNGQTTGIGPNGVNTGTNQGVGFGGQQFFGQQQGTSVGQGSDGGFGVGNNNNMNVAGLPITSGQETSFGPIAGDGSYVSNPAAGNYGPFGSPFGGFNQAFGVSQRGGVNVLGSGFTNATSVRAGWPYGATVSDGWDINAVGNRWVSNRTTFGWKPQGLTTHDFNTLNGIRAFNSGFENGTSGQAGINGYTANTGFAVPVLGQNTVAQANESSFDVSKMTFNSRTKGTYGPVDLVTSGTQFSAPFLGNLVQRGIWDDQFKKATGGQGVPGGVMNGGFIPNIPFVGRRR